MPRVRSGWYPSGEVFRREQPRAEPSDWLVEDQARMQLTAASGDVIMFDHWQRLGSGILLARAAGGFALDGSEPGGWQSCWNPADASAEGFQSLEDFAARWLIDGVTAVGVEFGVWTLDQPYRIESADDGLVAVPV